MPCVDATGRPRLARLTPALWLLALGSACSTWRPPTARHEPPSGAATSPSAPSVTVPSALTSAADPAIGHAASRTAAEPVAAAGPAAGGAARPLRRAAPSPGPVVLAPPRTARHWADFQQQAAERLVAASPGASYGGPVPEPLLAIPVLEIELNGDGSVRRILVRRQPRQALDTVQLAIDAVHRAAPFGAVSHLPRPWKFTEVFLFDEQRRFKPRTLDL